MKRKFGKVAYYFTLTCLMMSFILLGNSKDVTAATRKYVTASDLSIRKSATSSSKKVGSYKRGTLITCYGNKGSWTKVKYKGKFYEDFLKYTHCEENKMQIFIEQSQNVRHCYFHIIIF